MFIGILQKGHFMDTTVHFTNKHIHSQQHFLSFFIKILHTGLKSVPTLFFFSMQCLYLQLKFILIKALIQYFPSMCYVQIYTVWIW